MIVFSSDQTSFVLPEKRNPSIERSLLLMRRCNSNGHASTKSRDGMNKISGGGSPDQLDAAISIRKTINRKRRTKNEYQISNTEKQCKCSF